MPMPGWCRLAAVSITVDRKWKLWFFFILIRTHVRKMEVIMLWFFLAGGIGLTMLGRRFIQCLRQIPDRNEDFDVTSLAAGFKPHWPASM